MMDINYELYKVFYYVATSLSFSEASKQLYISQSAVSQSIKTLEKRLNQNLFSIYGAHRHNIDAGTHKNSSLVFWYKKRSLSTF